MKYEWKVVSIEKVNMDSNEDVVLQTYWRLTATSEDNISVNFDGATPLEYNPEATNFVPFSELTEELVLEWIKKQLIKQDGLDILYHELSEMIDEVRITHDKIEVSGDELPWS